MEYILEYWYIILAAIVMVVTLALGVYYFFKLPTNEQLNKVREWLLWAVTQAEMELGSGTGKLKLRQVYDLFVVRFPWMVKIVPFSMFSAMVDDALVEMHQMLEVNNAVRELVEGE